MLLLWDTNVTYTQPSWLVDVFVHSTNVRIKTHPVCKGLKPAKNTNSPIHFIVRIQTGLWQRLPWVVAKHHTASPWEQSWSRVNIPRNTTWSHAVMANQLICRSDCAELTLPHFNTNLQWSWQYLMDRVLIYKERVRPGNPQMHTFHCYIMRQSQGCISLVLNTSQ